MAYSGFKPRQSTWETTFKGYSITTLQRNYSSRDCYAFETHCLNYKQSGLFNVKTFCSLCEWMCEFQAAKKESEPMKYGKRLHHINIRYRNVLSAKSLCTVVSTLRGSMDCKPPSSSVYGIFQARILEWVAMFSSRGSSLPRDWREFLSLSCLLY